MSLMCDCHVFYYETHLCRYLLREFDEFVTGAVHSRTTAVPVSIRRASIISRSSTHNDLSTISVLLRTVCLCGTGLSSNYGE